MLNLFASLRVVCPPPPLFSSPVPTHAQHRTRHESDARTDRRQKLRGTGPFPNEGVKARRATATASRRALTAAATRARRSSRSRAALPATPAYAGATRRAWMPAKSAKRMPAPASAARAPGPCRSRRRLSAERGAPT